MKPVASTRKHPLQVLVVLLVCTALSGVDCTTTTTAPAPFARLENVVRGNRPASGTELGGLQVTRGEAALAMAPGMELRSGDRIVTDRATEAVIIFEDAYEVILATDTAITISPDFFVEFGKAVVKKLKELRKKFQAETKYVNAGAKGTEFAISVETGDVVSVVVLEGTVTLESTENRWSSQTINAREGAVVRSGQVPTRRERIPQSELDRTFGWARRVEAVVFPAEVPNVIRLPIAQARDEISRAQLRVGRIRNVAGQPEGTVLGQSPPAGQRVRYGTTVDLEVAVQVPVPNLYGMSQLEAGIALGFVGLNLGETSEEDDTGGRPGRVVRQYPPPGTRVAPGTPVAIVIASRRVPPPPPDYREDGGRYGTDQPPCTVPDVRDVPEERLSAYLKQSDLRLGRVQRVEGRRAETRQNPRAGARVRCGSSVDVVIYYVPSEPGPYQPPPETVCTVPDLSQVPPDRAAAFLRKYNLQLGSVRRAEGRASGVAQNPQPGTRVHCGSAVDLVIYSGPQQPPPETTCTVPDLRQVPVERAAEVLRKHRLQLGSVRRAEGRIATVAQNPEPGTQVRCGSSVDLMVYSGRSGTYDGPLVVQPTTCTVPDVRALNAEGARRTLKARGLVLGEFQAGGDERRQSPEPNTTVRCGTTVNVYAVIR